MAFNKRLIWWPPLCQRLSEAVMRVNHIIML